MKEKLFTIAITAPLVFIPVVSDDHHPHLVEQSGTLGPSVTPGVTITSTATSPGPSVTLTLPPGFGNPGST